MENKRESQANAAVGQLHGLHGKQLILASASPRRAEILRSVGWSFQTLAVEIDETPLAAEDAVSYVERLAREKAEAVAARFAQADAVVLGADTTVVVNGEKLVKPVDDADARSMLRRLSGRWHEVLTGVALIRTGTDALQLVSHERTRVRFAAMSAEEIDWYVATGEPVDKAGAYAVQGRAALFIEQIEGDYWNVVGLPVRLVYRLMREV